METLTVGELGEFNLLAQINALLRSENRDRLLATGDDCSALRWSPGAVVASCDAMVEGVHFLLRWTEPEDLAWKVLASAVSDLAAKGAEPSGVLITLGLLPDMQAEWVLRMYRFWLSLREPWACPVLGGDIVRSSVFFIDAFVIGRPIAETLLRMDTPGEGDRILVTGSLGDARAGLELLQAGREPDAGSPEGWLIRRFLKPTARVEEMRRLVGAGLAMTAATDISDGLERTLRNLIKASGLGAHVRAQDLPVSHALRHVKGVDAAKFAWLGGEDYELLLTVPPDQIDTALAISLETAVPLTEIGEMRGGDAHLAVEGLPEGETGTGYDHFV